jgi:filamentous hemagglutinin
MMPHGGEFYAGATDSVLKQGIDNVTLASGLFTLGKAGLSKLGRSGVRDNPLELITSHPDAHAFSVHGGSVTDADLIIRARTGLKPNGQTGPIPPLSSAFYSDDLLVTADQSVRNSGGLEKAIASQPGMSVVRVTTGDVGDLGVDLGYGYQRVAATGNKTANATLNGPLLRVDNLRSAQGIYEFNSVTGKWETITVYPAPH